MLVLGACGSGDDDGGDAAETATSVTAFPTLPPVTTTPAITLAPPTTVELGSGPTLAPAPATTVAGQPPGGGGGGGGGGGSGDVAGQYTVQPNDGLAKIADNLGVDYQALLDVNGFTADSLIVPGQKIKVPGGGSDSGAASADGGGGDDSSDTTAAGSGDVAGVYTVQANDYLTGIAEKLDVDYAELLAVNGFTDTSVIHPGDKIKVPA